MTRKKTQRYVSVKGDTYDRVKAHIATNGQTAAGFVERLVNEHLGMPTREECEKFEAFLKSGEKESKAVKADEIPNAPKIQEAIPAPVDVVRTSAPETALESEPVVKPAVTVKPTVKPKPVVAVKPLVKTKPVVAVKPTVKPKPNVVTENAPVERISKIRRTNERPLSLRTGTPAPELSQNPKRKTTPETDGELEGYVPPLLLF